jgi:hypothetical protein
MKMIRALLIATLSLSSTVVVTVSAINIPNAHSLDRRASRAQIPRALIDRQGECTIDLDCDPGVCWYVVLTFIVLITHHYPFSPTYLSFQ